MVYEDGDITVVNKPAGMVVHPAPGNPDRTLVNALLYRCGGSLSGIGGVLRPGIVHRIDRDTSGLLVVAKKRRGAPCSTEQLGTHTVSRVYTALCLGGFREESGTVTLSVGRSRTDRKKMAAYPPEAWRTDPGVRSAVTHYAVIDCYPVGARWGQSFSLVRCRLETGRTHGSAFIWRRWGIPCWATRCTAGTAPASGGRTPTSSGAMPARRGWS